MGESARVEYMTVNTRYRVRVCRCVCVHACLRGAVGGEAQQGVKERCDNDRPCIM